MENSVILRMFCEYQLNGRKINDKPIDAMGTDVLTFIRIIHNIRVGKY